MTSSTPRYLVLLFVTLGCSYVRPAADPSPRPPAEHARIELAYPGKSASMAFVLEEDRLLGRAARGEYIVVDVPGGYHRFALYGGDLGSVEFLEGEFEPGKIYRVRVSATWTPWPLPPFVVGTFHWEPLAVGTTKWNEQVADVSHLQRTELDPRRERLTTRVGRSFAKRIRRARAPIHTVRVRANDAG